MARFLHLPGASRPQSMASIGLLLFCALGLLLASSCSKSDQPASAVGGSDFIGLMNTGKNYLDQGQATNAAAVFSQAVALQPSRADALLNLANACLAANQTEAAIKYAREAISYDRNLAAAYYVAGSAYLRERQFEDALKMLQPCRDLDPNVAAVSYQIARAHQELGHAEEALAAYEDAIKLEPEHPVAHYALGQLLIRSGRQDEGLKAIARDGEIKAKRAAAPTSPEAFEKCKHTVAVAPLQIQKPDAGGIAVAFVDATSAAFGPAAPKYQGQLGVLDFNHEDVIGLFALETGVGFRVLVNNGAAAFKPAGEPVAAAADARFRRCLAGDLNNDRFEDVVMVGEKASQAFRFATNGAVRDATAASGLKAINLMGADAGLVDLDFTGKLDLLAVLPDGSALRLLRNLGNMYFKDITATSGIPTGLSGLKQIAIDDWNNDDLLDVFVSREGQPPLYLQKVRGGPLVATDLPAGPLAGTVIAVGDVNADSRADLLVGSADHIDLLLGGINKFTRLPIAQPGLTRLKLLDYDNDGWLDIFALGQGVQVWRNLGDGQFENVTTKTGLDKLGAASIEDLAAADFDRDGDSDLVFSVAGQGLKYLRNDGGNVNQQLKLRLFGQRSNASGLGIRVEVASGSFRVHRTVNSLPVEIGVGKRDKLDSLTARWFDLPYNEIDVKPEVKTARVVFEPTLPAGSCPYLYAWDGRTFRFVTDILGSAPVGLRVTDTIFADADPHEFVWIGNEGSFPPRDGSYVIQISEELREVLYLDEAKLVAVDHPAGTEVHTTDKFRPGKPFPHGELWTLGNPRPMNQALRLDGSDATALVVATDGQVLSPDRIRIPQLRGLAEPHGVILDFGPLPTDKPLVLVMTGWLRFGGGMANVGASHDPELPFPFPTLEVETDPGQWQAIEGVVGAPSGKTKTILVDLAGKLSPGAQRLRWKSAFEIHWDRIALMERISDAGTHVTRLVPDTANLHWRGFSEFAALPWSSPLTPVYDRTFQNAPWTITPTGWCTRYGPVNDLLAAEDNALVLLNGGDELTLAFDATKLPPKPAGTARDFFLYGVGWDKDADFHVELGWQVGPLPWHGMDDQNYGRQDRPAFPSDGLMKQYSTRWITQPTLKRASR